MLKSLFSNNKFFIKPGWLVVILIILSTLCKLQFLENTPLFGDEALYCALGTDFARTPFSQAWYKTVIYWQDPPGLMFLNSLVLSVFNFNNLIFACRATTVISSAFGAGFFYMFLRLLKRSKLQSLFGMILYIYNPIAFFFDRTNFMDSVLLHVSVIGIYFAYKYFLKGGMRTLLIFLILFGAGFLIKFNSLLFWASFGILYWSDFYKGYRFKVWLTCSIFLAFILILIFWKFTPVWHTVFYHVSGFDGWNLFSRFLNNLKLQLLWIYQFFTLIPFIGIIILTLRVVRQQKYKYLWPCLLIVNFYALISNNLFPRYLMILLPYLIIMTLSMLNNRIYYWILSVILVIFLFNDYLMLVRPTAAAIALQTNYEFFSDWGSGTGTSQAVDFLANNYEMFPVKLWIPTDIEGLWQIYIEQKAINLSITKTYFREIGQIDNSDYEQYKSILLITTPFHKNLIDWATQNNLPLIFASNGTERNSIIIYALKSK